MTPKQFTTYERTTGKVFSSGSSCSPELLENDEQGVLIGVTYSGGYILNGRHVNLPEMPSIHHVFDYKGKQWTDPRTDEWFIQDNRTKRNVLLTASDWTQLPDVPSSSKALWAIYRQALRDVTDQVDQRNIVWPVPPAK